MIKNFYTPDSLNKAVEFLKNNSSASPIAGGTFLSLHSSKKITSFVDLSQLDLNSIKKKNNSLIIGATTTFAQIAESKFFPPLSEITGNTATEPLRNMITAGGNVMIPLRWSDLPLIFLVLDASFVLRSPRKKIISADNFFKKLPKSILNNGELLTEIIIPEISKIKLARKKIVRAHDDFPALQLAVSLTFSRKKIDFIRIAFVANKPLPTRLKKTEKFLLNKIPDDSLIEQAAKIAETEVTKLNDIRFSNDYLKEMIRVYTRRLIHQCINQ